MNFYEFTEAVKNQIEAHLPEEYQGSEITLKDVVKNNVTLVGISIKRGGQNICPNIYLENFYEKMNDQELSLDEILDEIAEVRVQNDVASDFDVTKISDWSQAKGHIIPKLIGRENNDELLADRPNRVFAEDLAVIYAVDLGKDRNGQMSAPVTNSILETWGISKEELDSTALENLKQSKSEFRTMREVIMEMMGESMAEDMFPPEEEVPKMYILTNPDKINGANELLNAGTLKNISDRLGGDFTILPSSIHEVIILPQDVAEDSDMLRSMVCDVNNTQVTPEERLSNSVYRYDSATEQVVLAA